MSRSWSPIGYGRNSVPYAMGRREELYHRPKEKVHHEEHSSSLHRSSPHRSRRRGVSRSSIGRMSEGDHNRPNSRGSTQHWGVKRKGFSLGRRGCTPQESRKLEETQARGGSLSGRRSEDCQWKDREEDAKEKSILKEDERIKGVAKARIPAGSVRYLHDDEGEAAKGKNVVNPKPSQQIVVEQRESLDKQKRLYEKYKKSVEKHEYDLLKLKEHREALKRVGQKHEDYIMWENANLQSKLKYRITRMKEYMEELDAKVQIEMKNRNVVEMWTNQEERREKKGTKDGNFSSLSLASSARRH